MKQQTPTYSYKPSTHQILLSLSSSPNWVKKLLGLEKEYETFLLRLIDRSFFMDSSTKTTIKSIAGEVKLKPALVTKWLEMMYEDVFILNSDRPELFQSEGVKHTFFFKYIHDTSAWLTLWLKATPQQYETVVFPFVKAKVGFERFWVKEVTHSVYDGEQEIDVFLQGGFANQYREWLYDRAKFENVITFMESMQLNEGEVDDILLRYYRK